MMVSRSGVLSDGEAILGMVDPENLCGDAGLTSGEGLTGRVRSVCGVDADLRGCRAPPLVQQLHAVAEALHDHCVLRHLERAASHARPGVDLVTHSSAHLARQMC